MKKTPLSPRKPKRLQIVFLATGAFAVPSMKAICDSGLYDVICLVTNPPRRDRTGNPIPTPARLFAEEYGITISDKEDVHAQEFFDLLYLVRPDILFVCDFGQILSAKALKGAILGGINLHASLLPKYRGAAPVHWAVMNGDPVTGVSVIHMTPKIDAGPVIAQSPLIPIGVRETVEELEERLAYFGADLVLGCLHKMAQGETVRIIEQLHGETTKAPRLKKEQGRVDWQRSSRTIFNYQRAMSHWPKSSTDWVHADGKRTRIIMGRVTPLDDSLETLVNEDFSDPMYVGPMLTDAKWDNLAMLKEYRRSLAGAPVAVPAELKARPDGWTPGLVLKAEDDELIVVAGEGALSIFELQPAGKRMMSVRDFLRGYRVRPGDRFE